jgi:hypothetical protein
LFGSIINSVCSFFRAARVSFDRRPINVLICPGLNFNKMMIMFVLEAADRYDRHADADPVLVTELAFDAASDLAVFLSRREITCESEIPNWGDLFTSKWSDLASRVHTVASHIARESIAINNLPHLDVKRKPILKTCASVATLAARTVAYCCALEITDTTVVDPMYKSLNESLNKYFTEHFRLQDIADDAYFLNPDVSTLTQMNLAINNATMTLLNMERQPSFNSTAISNVEAIVARDNHEAALKERDAVTELLKHINQRSAHSAQKLVSNAESCVEFTKVEAAAAEAMDAFHRQTDHRSSRVGEPHTPSGGKSRRKSRKNVKKNTRRNKKFRKSSKTKKRRRCYSRKNGRQ